MENKRKKLPLNLCILKGNRFEIYWMRINQDLPEHGHQTWFNQPLEWHSKQFFPDVVVFVILSLFQLSGVQSILQWQTSIETLLSRWTFRLFGKCLVFAVYGTDSSLWLIDICIVLANGKVWCDLKYIDNRTSQSNQYFRLFKNNRLEWDLRSHSNWKRQIWRWRKTSRDKFSWWITFIR